MHGRQPTVLNTTADTVSLFRDSGGDDGSVIDVLVVYSNQANDAGILAEIVRGRGGRQRGLFQQRHCPAHQRGGPGARRL
jgi:hypothetical protein